MKDEDAFLFQEPEGSS